MSAGQRRNARRYNIMVIMVRRIRAHFGRSENSFHQVKGTMGALPCPALVTLGGVR